ncbi:MAG: hypothetical protein JSV48_00055, partial [Bradyrhizobium sp.]
VDAEAESGAAASQSFSRALASLSDVTSASCTPRPAAAISPPRTLILPPRASSDIRSEVLARVANFRKHQERFKREREDYCAATLTRLRDAIRDAAPRPPAGK